MGNEHSLISFRLVGKKTGLFCFSFATSAQMGRMGRYEKIVSSRKSMCYKAPDLPTNKPKLLVGICSSWWHISFTIITIFTKGPLSNLYLSTVLQSLGQESI